MLARWPELTWQQLHNRLRWSGGTLAVAIEEEAELRSGPGRGLWVRRLTPPIESPTLLFTLARHDSPVVALAFSPDASLLVTGSYVDAMVWSVETGDCLQALDGGARPVAFSPDGQRLAAADGASVVIWSTATWHRLLTLEGDHGHHSLRWIDFSPDGSLVATARSDEPLLWDAHTGDPLHRLSGHADVKMVRFDTGGSRLVTAGKDGTTRLWRTADGACLAVLEGHDGKVNSAAFSPDGRRVVTAGDDGTVRVWDVATGACSQILDGHSKPVRQACFTPDGTTVATSSDDATTLLWDIDDEECIDEIPTGAPIAISPDGRRIVTTGVDTGYVWDATGEHATAVDLVAHTRNIDSLAISPDGTRIATAGGDQTARIWDATAPFPDDAEWEHRQSSLQQLHSSWVTDVVFSPDGRRIASGSLDHTARLWDPATGRSTGVVLEGHRDEVGAVAFHPDARRLATMSMDGTSRIWDVSTGEAVLVLGPPDDLLMDVAVAFDPDGRRLATAALDNSAILWDCRTGERLHRLTGHTEWVANLTFSPDGRRLATVGLDGTIRVWETATGRQRFALSSEGETDYLELVGQFGGASFMVRDAAFNPDGSRLITALGDDRAVICDAESADPLLTLEGHTDRVTSVGYGPDGSWVVTTSADGTARVWDALDGKVHRVLAGPRRNELVSSQISRNGRYIATIARYQASDFWDARTGDRVGTLPVDAETIALSPTEPLIAYGTGYGEVQILRIEGVEDWGT